MNHIWKVLEGEHVQELQVHDRAVRVWCERTEPKQEYTNDNPKQTTKAYNK